MLPTVKLNYGAYLTPFRTLLRDVIKLPVLDNMLEQLEVEIKKEAFSLRDNYRVWNEFGSSNEEDVALKGLSANRNVIIQNSGRGNSVVLLNRNDYIKRISEILSDSCKFKKLNIKLEKILILCHNKITGSLIFLKSKKVYQRLAI